MTFIETVPEDEAAGPVAQMYAADRELGGFVRNFAKAFSLAPEVYVAWQGLSGAIKARMDLRRYELVTLAAARTLRSSYCALAHGSVLLDQFFDADAVEAIAAGHRPAGLDEVDVAVMNLAEKVAADAPSVTAEDIERLRELGLADAEIFDVISAAAVRCFFSKTLDALGAEPDARYREQLGAELRDVLTVGRPIAST